MSDFWKKTAQQFEGFGSELLQGIRDHVKSHEGDAVYNERIENITTATMAMYDAGLEDEIIIQMLQKYWDLRRSEAEKEIAFAHTVVKK